MSLPPYLMASSHDDKRLALCGRVDKLIRVVGPTVPLQYLRHTDPVVSAQWRSAAPDETAALLTLDAGGVL